MSLHDLYGHESLMNRLVGALASGRFPQALLLSGPAGVGKQRVALALAEALLCSEEGPCGGDCPAARQVRRLAHPDLHWLVPIVPSGKSSGPDKQIEEAETALGEIMAERRESPIYGPLDGRASHSIASARILRKKVGMTPFQARRKVVIVGDADRLVAQESSLEAANTLLKVLEEPPKDTFLILTSSVPEALLPTIRSRLVAVRVGRLRDSEVERFLIEQVNTPADKARRIAEGAEGSVGRALAAAGSGDPATRAAARFLKAVEDGPLAWAGEALMQQPWGARGAHTALLDQLAVQLRSKLQGILQDGASGADNYLEAIRLVQKHRVETQRNLNPQVGLAVLASDMAAVL